MLQRRIVTGFVVLCGTVLLSLGGCNGLADKEAQRVLREQIGRTSVTVFPAYVRDGKAARYDAETVQRIGEFLTREGLATVTFSDVEVSLSGAWSPSQPRMLRASARDFGAHVKASGIKTAYALLPEYLISGRGKVVGVHLYMVDADGTLAYAILSNSHHPEFTQVDPRTTEDCTTIALKYLSADLGQLKSATADAAPAMGPSSSLTVLPVKLAGQPSKDVADALGLLLEKDGMRDVRTIEAAFETPAEAPLEQVSNSVSEFVRRNPTGTDYTLYAEFAGSHETGITEVRGVLVDAGGKVVWSDSQTPADADFKRIKPRNPMTCCVLAAERLGPRFKLSADTRTVGDEGRMARLSAEKSGRPSEAEREALAARQVALRADLAEARLLIYPVLLGGETSLAEAARLGNRLVEELGCATALAEEAPPISVPLSSNEQRVLWDTAKAFRTHVRANPPDEDYALLAEYIIRPRDKKVWAVHFFVCDRAGQWVIVDFQNEYQPDFQAIRPKSVEDCGRLVVRRMVQFVR